MRLLSLLILFCSLIMGHSNPCQASDNVEPSGKVVAMVEPILEAELATRKQDTEANEFKVGKLLGKVFEDQSPVGDESLVVLLDFYIGEANGGDLLHQITVRGKRLLPLLLRYRDKTTSLENQPQFAELKLPVQIRRQNFATTISFIRKGKVYGSE